MAIIYLLGPTRLLIDAIDSAITCPAASPVGTKCVYLMYSMWVQLVCLSLKHDGTKMTMPTNSHVSMNVENTNLTKDVKVKAKGYSENKILEPTFRMTLSYC